MIEYCVKRLKRIILSKQTHAKKEAEALAVPKSKRSKK